MANGHVLKLLPILIVFFAAALPATAALQLNEILFDPFDGNDFDNEYIEIIGDPGESTANVWLLVVDNNGTDIGELDYAIDLTPATSTGANGLLLVRESAAVILPAPDAGTTVFLPSGGFLLQNSASTYVLVVSSVDLSASVGQKLANNDGTLKPTPWDGAVLDAVYMADGDGEPSIAAGLGGVDSATPSFTPMYAFRNPHDQSWESARVSGASGGPFTISATQVTDPAFAGESATPGGNNSTPVTISGYEID